MRQFNSPRLVVSKCLEFAKCRYNGEVIPSKFIKSLESFVDFIQVCPEVEIGLGTPRDTIKIVEDNNGHQQLVQPKTERDLTSKMSIFSKAYLKTLPDIDGFILKASSPSCGLKDVKIYPTNGNGAAKYRSSGMFARHVLEQYGMLAVEDEGRLTNFRIRESFLTKIFLFADFRQLKANPSVRALVEFQTHNKLIYMAYNQKYMQVLGRIVAQATQNNLNETLLAYEENLRHVFVKNASFRGHINVLEHALGYFKKELKADEKKLFLDLLRRFRIGKIPLSSLLTVLQSWVVRYDQEYLAKQTYFEPYPEELIEITDSGKGRDGK